MPEEDHRFKKVIIHTDEDTKQFEEAKEAEREQKVREFQWDDIEDEEPDGEPFIAPDSDIEECISLLTDHVINNITGEHFSGMDGEGIQFVIPVNLDFHSLLRVRFEDQWELESRLMMFDRLRDGLMEAFLESDKRESLDEKLQEALPPTHRKKFTSGTVTLIDDAMVVDDESDMVSIEIPVQFTANL